MSYLTSLFINPSDPSLFLYGSHNPWLVALSLLIAIFASAMALQVAGMARLSDNRLYRQVALITGSLALGGGVWSMHFIGMLAFQLCARVEYAPGLTLLSLLPSLFASWVALQLLVRNTISSMQLISSGVLVGAGIGAMHYSGMAAMQMAPLLRYDPYWFALSILVAVVLAILALWVRFGLRGWIAGGRAILASGVVMGLAIAGMHYTGMAAARFIGSVEPLDQQNTADSVFIALAVALATVSLTIFVAAANGLLRYRLLYRQMQDSESRLRAILETAVDGIVIIDERGLIEGLNTAAEHLYGWRKDELIGQHINVLTPESYHQGALDYLPRLMREGKSDIVGGSREVEAQCRDGSLRPIRLAIGLVNLPGKTLYVGFISDISERKKMEQALREREQQYRSLIGNIPGVAFRCLLDDNWSMLFISDAVEKLTGWTADDFISRRKSISELYHPEDIQRVSEEVLAEVALGRHYTVEYRLYDRQGEEHWIWESGSAVLDERGQPKWIDGVLLDITESKLRNAEFESTVTAISRAQAVVEFDLQGHVLTANRNYLDLMGYDLEEIRGQHHRIFCAQSYADSGAYEQFWARLARGELDSGEYLRIGKGGREVWIQATYNPIFDADGKPFKVVKFATDLSQRREMEEALRDAKERAEQAAEAKTSFLANMSHEIRTPMNAIIGFTELLLDSRLDEPQRRHLGTVRQAARSLLGLLNDILDTAKLERGALQLESMDFSLRTLCEQVCAALRLSAEAKGLSLSLDYQSGLAEHFVGDPLRIQQVLTNLVGNAVKFTEQGWVRLEVSGAPGQVVLAVRDSGIGIAADRLAHIFDPFAQADASMSRRFGGTGLGTTIARQLAELMGGHITVESRLGEGSLFCLELPLQAGQAPAMTEPAAAVQLPPLRILAADDVPQNLELLSLSLSQLGHQVVQARDGEEVLAACFGAPFDLLLMDVQMPRLDGLEATRRIRQHEQANGLPAMPIIALTASVLEQDRRAAREAGMDGFASKPLELDKLLTEMAIVLGLAQRPTGALEAAGPVQQDLLVDWSQGMQLWGSHATLVAAIRRFLGEHAGGCDAIKRLLAAGEQLAAIEQVHRLRGAAANLALLRVSHWAGQLEHALKGKLAASSGDLLAALQAALDELPAQLPAQVELDAGVAPALELSELMRLIGAARNALQHGELAEQPLRSLLLQLPALACQAQAQALERAIDDFDFEHADALLAELLGWLQGQSGDMPR